MNSGAYKNPTEHEDSAPEEKPQPQEESSPSEAITPSQDPLVHLQAELEEVKGESEQWRDRFLRKAAEFDNYRKRIEKEKAENTLLAKITVLMEFLSVADACERALGSFSGGNSEQSSLEHYRNGVELLYKQLLDVLSRLGVTPIQAQGTMFDPNIHEAIAREVTADVEENTVTQVLRRGYLFKDRLLRPAQVNVAVNPHPEKQNA
jgi:molecular chaperone GrpE